MHGISSKLAHQQATPAARRLSWLLVGAGVLAITDAYVPDLGSFDRVALAAVGAWAIAFGLVVRALPWARWPHRSTLALLPPTFGLGAAAHALGDMSSYSFTVFFVLAFAWIGAHHAPGTSVLVAPLAGVAFVAPALAAAPRADAAVSSVLAVIPVGVLVAETLSRANASAREARRESERRARLISIGATAARAIHALEPQQVFKVVVDAVAELGCESAALVIVDQERATLVVGHAAGWLNDRPIPDGLVRRVIAEQKTCTALGGEKLIATPVRSDRRVAVLIAAFTQAPAAEDVEALELVASQAGPALENAERFRAERRAKRLAEVSSLKDELTGAGNRRRGAMLLDQLTRGDAIALVDIDNFKAINDRDGHAAGDDVLRAFVACAREALRGTDEIVRYGGDEFLLILPGAGEEALAAVQRLRLDWLGSRASATFSAGVVVVESTEPPAVTLAKADRALYASKHAGRDTVTRFSGSVSAEIA